jgi:hypothetical protein
MQSLETSRLGFALGLGIILNIFLPKAGVYAGGVPLTWGYLFLLPATLWGTVALFFHGHLSMGRFLAFVCTLPFAAVAALTVASNGAEQVSFTIALFVTFFFLPFCLYVAFDDFLPREKSETAFRFVAAGFVFVAAWGILGFFFAAFSKAPLDIPFITTGGGSELSSIDRNNWRGALYKLTSTFNNGNIYGICALMALPIVSRFQSRWKTSIVKLSILLTLSRTAWAGLIFYELGHAVLVRGRRDVLKYLLIVLSVGAALVSILLTVLGTDTAFILSADLGGRLHTYENIGTILPFSPNPYGTIFEIVYPSILTNFGYLGLAAFLLAMLAPFWLRHIDPRPYDTTDRSIILGMTTYLLLCWSDGALLYIPSMFFYLSLATILLATPTQSRAFGVTAIAAKPQRTAP